jgi:hypothetical protein
MKSCPTGAALPESLVGPGGKPPVDPLIYQTDRRPAAGTTSDLLMVKVRYKLPDAQTSQLLTRPVTMTPASTGGALACYRSPRRSRNSDCFSATTRRRPRDGTGLTERLKSLAWPVQGAADREAFTDLVGLAAGIKKMK